MKVIFEFNKPEDNEDLELHLKAINYHCAISEFANQLRSKIKYTEMSNEKLEAYEEVRTLLYYILKEEQIEL